MGIEAARNILIEEISSVCDDAGEYINSRHIELLVDVMTNKGSLTPINSQGVKKVILVHSLNQPLKTLPHNLLKREYSVKKII